MTAADHDLELRTTRRSAGIIRARARGEVTLSTAPILRRGLAKLLADGVPVLLDVSQLRLAWTPAAELFVTAVSAAGGWPGARLVLFGADADTTERLRVCRVPESVPLAATVEEAAARAASRPARVARRVDFPGGPASVPAARDAVRETCREWGLPDADAAAAVVTELATRAVEEVGGGFRLRLVLGDTGLRVSVHDGSPVGPPGALPLPRSSARSTDAEELHLPVVEHHSRSWGVLRYDAGTTVWALVPVAPDVAATPGRTVPRTSSPSRSATGRRAPHVTPPRRRRYTTADPEGADEFLRSVYGAKALRLTGADIEGFSLEHEGVQTNCFAVERLAHTMAVDALLAPAEALVVVHTLAGGLRVETGYEERSAAPGEIVLFDARTATRLRGENAEVELVRLRRAAVVPIVAELTGVDPASVRFDTGHPVSPARARHWQATLRHLRYDVLPNDEVMASRLSRAAVLRTLVTMLVETFPNPAVAASTAAAAEAGRGRLAPSTVRRAVRFIEDHAGQDIGLADVAAAAGIGPRSLQLAFRRHHDVTPLEYLRRVRLDRAHQELQAAGATETSVAAVAARWGFAHHSNFSAAYLRAYGCSPSVTLRS